MRCYVLWLDGSSFPRRRKAFALVTGQKAMEGQALWEACKWCLWPGFVNFKKQNRWIIMCKPGMALADKSPNAWERLCGKFLRYFSYLELISNLPASILNHLTQTLRRSRRVAVFASFSSTMKVVRNVSDRSINFGPAIAHLTVAIWNVGHFETPIFQSTTPFIYC